MTLGAAAQVATAHCPNERTLDPTVCSYNRPTYVPASRTLRVKPITHILETGAINRLHFSGLVSGTGTCVMQTWDRIRLVSDSGAD